MTAEEVEFVLEALLGDSSMTALKFSDIIQFFCPIPMTYSPWSGANFRCWEAISGEMHIEFKHLSYNNCNAIYYTRQMHLPLRSHFRQPQVDITESDLVTLDEILMAIGSNYGPEFANTLLSEAVNFKDFKLAMVHIDKK